MPRLRHFWPLGLLVGFVAALPLWSATRSLPFLSGVYRYPPVAQPEVDAFYWTVLTPDIVNLGREEQGSVSV